MTDKLHTLFTVDDGIHIAHAWSLADYAARAALELVPSDVGRVAFVLEDLKFWILADDDGGEGPIWKDITFVIDAGSTSQSVGSANAPGVSDVYAREDHVHDASSKADVLLSFNPQTGTTYTFVLSDHLNKVVTASNAAAQAYTVPPVASVAFPVGAKLQVLVLVSNANSQVTFTPGAGVTIEAPTGMTLKSRTAGTTTGTAFCTLIHRATNTWTLVGDVSVS